MITAALDTSVSPCFALKRDEELIVNESYSAPLKRSEQILLPWIQDKLDKQALDISHIDKWIVGLGPGSFTGIRTGISLVKGICFDTQRSYEGVPSTIPLVWPYTGGGEKEKVIATLHDGRRDQAILTKYCCTRKSLQQREEPHIIEQLNVTERTKDCHMLITPHKKLGKNLPESIQNKLDVVSTPEARFLLDYVAYDRNQAFMNPPEACEPIYVRPPVFVNPLTDKTSK